MSQSEKANALLNLSISLGEPVSVFSFGSDRSEQQIETAKKQMKTNTRRTKPMGK
jgi:hypothetical protein